MLFSDVLSRLLGTDGLQPGRAPTGPMARLRHWAGRRAKLRQQLHAQVGHLSGRLVRVGVLVLLLAVGVDLLVQRLLPDHSLWLRWLVHVAVLAPVLALEGYWLVHCARRRERALLRREARCALQQHRDPLTRALSRSALIERIDSDGRLHPRRSAALLVLDVHDFQRINDACGHAVGDVVLQAIAQRLRQRSPGGSGAAAMVLSEEAILARVGADEFALWLPQVPDNVSVHPVAQQLLAVLDAPLVVGLHELQLRGCVGYVSQPAGTCGGLDWLTRCNTAVQQAKRRGVGAVVAFAPAQHQLMVRRHHVQQDLRCELQHGRGLTLNFQPMTRMVDGRLVGAEVLLRWHHPYLGSITPSEFIAVAESSDLIGPLGLWVLDRALAQLARWRAEGLLAPGSDFKLAVNLSRLQLQDPALPERVRQLLQTHGIEPAALELEVTETHPLDDAETLHALRQLRAVGVTLALDDFGTGYSSLSVLLKLPLQAVKIDRQLVSCIDHFPQRSALVAGVVRTAALMGMDIVAEGVEREQEALAMARLGCHRQQGWLVGKPCDAPQFAQQWLLPQVPHSARMQVSEAQAPPVPGGLVAGHAATRSRLPDPAPPPPKALDPLLQPTPLWDRYPSLT